MQSKQKQRKIWLSRQGLSQVQKHLLRLQLWNRHSRFWCTSVPPSAPPALGVLTQCREASQGPAGGAVHPLTICQRQEMVQLCRKSHHRQYYGRGQHSEGTFPVDCIRADMVSKQRNLSFCSALFLPPVLLRGSRQEFAVTWWKKMWLIYPFNRHNKREVSSFCLPKWLTSPAWTNKGDQMRDLYS